MKLQVYYTQWIKINSIYFPLHSPIIMINSFASLKNFFFIFLFSGPMCIMRMKCDIAKNILYIEKKNNAHMQQVQLATLKNLQEREVS